tara:strand:+ start:1223 stop:1516 length:294 start_codon:yes stop_codon:yes gene_type:complete
MSRGKYSLAYKYWPEGYEHSFNCYGEEPAPWAGSVNEPNRTFDEKTMFGNYDEEGYDYYGYSAFDENGEYISSGNGIDRAGFTEMDYLMNVDGGYND